LQFVTEHALEPDERKVIYHALRLIERTAAYLTPAQEPTP
jgi:hypothetical protein